MKPTWRKPIQDFPIDIPRGAGSSPSAEHVNNAGTCQPIQQIMKESYDCESIGNE